MSNKSEITNTARTMPFVYGSTDPKDIYAAEARGQRELVASSKLPIHGSENPALVTLGFTFGAPVPGDPLFREATLPPGWKKVGSDHDMWSYIEDERGIRRVGVFYKAAPYDRRADMNIQNVGYAVATKIEDGGKVPWDLLTEQERSDALSCLRADKERTDKYIREGRAYPDDQKRLDRITAALAMYDVPASSASEG